MTDPIDTQDARAVHEAATAGPKSLHPFNPAIMDHLIAITADEWSLASQWADTAKRLMPDMEDARWHGIRHGFACGLAYGKMNAAAELDTLRARLAALEGENGRLREALDFYGANHEWPNEGPWGVDSIDFGTVARAALAAGATTDD